MSQTPAKPEPQTKRTFTTPVQVGGIRCSAVFEAEFTTDVPGNALDWWAKKLLNISVLMPESPVGITEAVANTSAVLKDINHWQTRKNWSVYEPSSPG